MVFRAILIDAQGKAIRPLPEYHNGYGYGRKIFSEGKAVFSVGLKDAPAKSRHHNFKKCRLEC
ncbi:MAG: hypothetical protein ACE15F_15925 [bacterium]